MKKTSLRTLNEAKNESPKFFISYCIDDKKLVFETCNILALYFGRNNMYLFEERPQ